MTDRSVNESIRRINQDKMSEILAKSEALLQVALHSELKGLPTYIVHDYLWVLSDLVNDAQHLV